jgi:aminoglycoside 3-N-acetyltransferase
MVEPSSPQEFFMPETKELTEHDLIQGLRTIGLHTADKIMVHSSLSSFGRVAGGPLTVIRALQEVLTPAGTLLMPSFNHNKPWRQGGDGIYDPTRTPTSNGAIPDAFWRVPGVFRSLNPSHPFACWGKDAQRYIQFHHRTLTMGPDSPLGLLAREGGLGLLLGVEYGPNTFHHVVEMTINSPCLGQRTEAYAVRLPNGRTVSGRTWGWRDRACPITDSARYAPLMAAHEKRGRIGSSNTILFKLSDAHQVIARALHEGLAGFPPCSRCPFRPRVTSHTVESDWDPATQSLKPDSLAWTY